MGMLTLHIESRSSGLLPGFGAMFVMSFIIKNINQHI